MSNFKVGDIVLWNGKEDADMYDIGVRGRVVDVESISNQEYLTVKVDGDDRAASYFSWRWDLVTLSDTVNLNDIVTDLVNSPPHYQSISGIECIEAIKAQMSDEEYRGYLRGNVVKYLWRYQQKGGKQSLEKARWYLDKLIGETE